MSIIYIYYIYMSIIMSIKCIDVKIHQVHGLKDSILLKNQFSQNWSIISVQFQELKKPNGVDNPEIILLQMKIKVIYKI